MHFCIGSNRQSANWQPRELTLDELMDRLNSPIRTPETVQQYHAMPKKARDGIKDKGGFLAGTLKGVRRQKAEVISRSMITLDCDQLKPSFLDGYRQSYHTIVYTTHSHLPEAPRARILFPLTRDITPDEYNAIARYLAAELGMEMLDPCSFEINQMMYWPTVSKDGEYICRVYEGAWLDPDTYLAKHPYWKDLAGLPRSEREKKLQNLPKKNQENPRTKTGIVGDFCRAYTVQEAIAQYLSDVYAPTETENRYDYIAGEGRCGVVIYDDVFAYSHHSTDPAGGKLLNAFDLVRIHKFGTDDEALSYKNMRDLALNDEKVCKNIQEAKQSDALNEFAPTDPSWDAPISLDDSAMPDFPMDALPAVLRNYAASVAESTQTATDMAAVAILAAVSVAMRNLYKVEGKADWHEPTNLYTLMIAEPSERKSAVLSMITKPIDEYVQAYNAQHKVEFEMSNAMKQKLENRKRALINKSSKRGQDGPGEDFNDELQELATQIVEFKEVRPLKVYVDDTTPEKLVETLAENNNAISIISSEGGIFDVLSGTYANRVNIDVFLKAYSGEHISVDRIMRNSVAIDDACLTILLSVQPVVIGDLMKNEKFRHRGLTARFLYTHPKSLVGSRDFESVSVSVDVYAKYRELMHNILSEKRGKTASLIRLNEDAAEVVHTFYDWVEQRLVDEYSVYSDWIGKLVGNTLRIAGILARASVLKKDVEDALLETDEEIKIDGQTMRNAVRIGRYFFSHAIRAYSTMGIYSEYRSLLRVVEKIKEKGAHIIRRRDIMRFCRWIVSAEEAQRIVDAMEDYGYARLIAVDNADKLRNGRPKNPTYAVNPTIFE